MATESDNVNSGALGTLVAVGTIAFFGIALVVTALVRAEMADEAEKKEVAADRPYRDLVAEQKAKLDAPAAYVDRGRGLVSLPIERAMELVVSNLKKDPNSATPPAPAAAGSGGVDAATAGSGGTGGASAESGGTGGTAEAPPNEATHAEGNKPAEPKEETKDEKKEPSKGEKKEGTKPKPAPVAPAPAPAAPAPAPAPAPNGQ
jgi:hypothetical protein